MNSATNPATSGTVEVTFCGSEPAGTYTVRGTGFYQIIPAVQLPFALPETTFQVRPAATRTTLSDKSLGHGHYQLTTRVREESERGSAGPTASRSGWSGSCPGSGSGSVASR